VQCGPQATEARILMRQALPAAVDRIWREKRSGVQDSAFTTASLAEQVSGAIAEEGRAAGTLATARGDGQEHRGHPAFDVFADGETAIQAPFLLIPMFWLVVVFASYSLFVEPGRVVIAALVIFALSISSALFLVADLSQPFVGLMQIPKELQHALAPLN
jgi:hypothetical protein